MTYDRIRFWLAGRRDQLRHSSPRARANWRRAWFKLNVTKALSSRKEGHVPVALRAGSLDLHLIVTCDKLRSGADAHAVLGHVDWQLRALRRALRSRSRSLRSPTRACKPTHTRRSGRTTASLSAIARCWRRRRRAVPEAQFGALLASCAPVRRTRAAFVSSSGAPKHSRDPSRFSRRRPPPLLRARRRRSRRGK